MVPGCLGLRDGDRPHPLAPPQHLLPLRPDPLRPPGLARHPRPGGGDDGLRVAAAGEGQSEEAGRGGEGGGGGEDPPLAQVPGLGGSGGGQTEAAPGPGRLSPG